MLSFDVRFRPNLQSYNLTKMPYHRTWPSSFWCKNWTSTHSSKTDLTFGTFSDKCSWRKWRKLRAWVLEFKTFWFKWHASDFIPSFCFRRLSFVGTKWSFISDAIFCFGFINNVRNGSIEMATWQSYLLFSERLSMPMNGSTLGWIKLLKTLTLTKSCEPFWKNLWGFLPFTARQKYK